MKKYYLTIIAALAAITASAQSENINTSWANLFEACPPTMGCDMALTSDAIYYVMLSGTTQGAGESGFPKEFSDPTLSIYYGGNKICTGAPYEGASYNNNINVVKTDRDGNFEWVIYSTSGEFADGRVTTAADGGIYVATKVRHTDNMRTSNIIITDATGTTTTLDWQLESEEDSRYYRGMLMKIDAGGTLQWLRTIDVSTAAQPGATGNYVNGTHDAISIDDIIADDSGNCYVAGQYRNPMSLYRADGTTLALTPHNTDGWNGDTQETRGDMFVAKFDADGYIIDTFTTQGHCGAESMTRVEWRRHSVLEFCQGQQQWRLCCGGQRLPQHPSGTSEHLASLPQQAATATVVEILPRQPHQQKQEQRHAVERPASALRKHRAQRHGKLHS